jgi:hypothetical protein
MKSADFLNEAGAVAVDVGSAALTFAIVGLAKRALSQIVGTVLVALMLLQLVAYFICSSKLIEFKAPGGIEAKFTETAKETVRSISETIVYDDLQIVAREGGVRKLQGCCCWPVDLLDVTTCALPAKPAITAAEIP